MSADLEDEITDKFSEGARLRDLASEYFSNPFATQKVQDLIRACLKRRAEEREQMASMGLVGTVKKIAELERELSGLRQFWIDASEQQPDQKGTYFVRRIENPIPTAREFDGRRWRSSATITHWAKVPPVAKTTEQEDQSEAAKD